MDGDTNKKLIGKFQNGAQLFRLFNRVGILYFTIEMNGMEYYSVEGGKDEPDRMIRAFEQVEKTRLLKLEEEE